VEGARAILQLLSSDLFLLLYLLLQLLFLIAADKCGPLGTCRLREVNAGLLLGDHLLSRALPLRWTEEEGADRVVAPYVVG